MKRDLKGRFIKKEEEEIKIVFWPSFAKKIDDVDHYFCYYDAMDFNIN